MPKSLFGGARLWISEVLVRLFADEDVYGELKQRLAEMGHDVQSPFELGIRGVGDEVCFLHAAFDARVILTHNATDYSLLHHAWLAWAGHWNIAPQPTHPGVVAAPHKDLLDVHTTALRVDALLQDLDALTNPFIRLHPSGRQTFYD